MKKQTKQQIIDDLEKKIATLRVYCEEQDKEIENIKLVSSKRKNKLEEILLGKRITYCNDMSWDDIITTVIRLKQKETTEGQILPLVDWNIKEENAKLWYMMRVAMKDELLKEPIDLETSRSRFIKPNFNQ